jgi:RNA polymerase sigma factor (sigma-70 family)
MSGPSTPILHYLRRLAAGRGADPRDGDLLRLYLERHDEAAFTALVERHGPMVLGVCRSVLRHRQDAEDAFQATFLVLAKKAASVRRSDAVASWLHGVAYRVALRARAAGARRQAREAKAAGPAPALSADDLSWGEVRATLHAELAALPQRFREPLVLCYLQGLTHDEAARRLGWPGSTVKGRLQRGRTLLRARLERRGFGLGAALGAAALTGPASAGPLPRALTAAAVRAAIPLPGAAAEGPAAGLARGALGHPALAKFGPAAALLLTLALAGGLLWRQAPADGGRAPDEKAAPGPAAAAPPADRHGDPLPDGAVARLGTVRFNHGEGLNALHFTPDGKTLLSEGRGLLRLWDAATGKELKHFATALTSFDVQALMPDGKTLVALNQGSHDTLHFWDLAQGKEVRVLKLPRRRAVQSVYLRNALAPDGRLCAVNNREDVRVFDVATAKELCKLPGKVEGARTVLFAGNDRLVTADKKGAVSVWEARTGKLVRRFALGAPAERLAVSPDGRRLASLERREAPFQLPNRAPLRLHDRDVIHLWDLATGARKHALAGRPKRWHLGLRFSPDGKRLFAAAADEEGPEAEVVTVWDAETGRQVRELGGAGWQALAVSPDGTRLAAGDHSKFDLWDLKTGRRLSPAESPQGLLQPLVLSPGGDRVFTFGHASVSAWDGAGGRRLGSSALPPYPYSDPNRSRLFGPDGRYAVTLAENKGHLEILVWDVPARRRLHTLRAPDSAMPVTSAVENLTRPYDPPNVRCALSADSSLLATCHSGKDTVFRLWDLRTGKELRSFKGTNPRWVNCLSFTRDGKTLLAAGHHTVGFDVATGKELFAWRLKPLPNTSGGRLVVGGRVLTEDDEIAWRAVAVSPDGALVACILTAGGFSHAKVADRIALCDARTGKFLRRWGDSGKPAPWGEQILFSPDGRLLASSDGDAVHLWEVATGKVICTLRGHRGQIQSLAFSANGRRLASGSPDSTVLLWDLTAPGRPPGPRAEKAGEKAVAGWWADLAGADAARAHAASWRLAEAPRAALPFLRQRLRPAAEAEVRAIRQDVLDLNSKTFAVRNKAFERLKKRDLAARPLLREAAGKDLPLEARRRVEQLLEGLRSRPLSGESLRTLRALAVLERAGTPEARGLLRELAAGAREAWLTGEARAAQERVASAKAP